MKISCDLFIKNKTSIMRQRFANDWLMFNRVSCQIINFHIGTADFFLLYFYLVSMGKKLAFKIKLIRADSVTIF